MLHIAIVIPTLAQIGGAENQALLLAEGLAFRGWRVTLIALSGDVSGLEYKPEGISPQVYNKLAGAGVQLLSLHMRKAWVDARGWQIFVGWFRVNRPAIVHAHLPHATWFARWVRLLAPTRVVLETLHTGRKPSLRARLGYRLSNWLSNRTTCVSDAVARMALEAGLVLPAHFTVIPNGIAISDEAGCEEGMPGQDGPRSFQWVAVGRLAPVKDYPTLLRAFAKLRQSAGRDALPSTLVILGAGEEELYLRQLTRLLGLDAHVRFAGFVEDIQPLLRESDAFVLSSKWEGLPVGVLEAEAAGLPVVATDGAGTGEAMLDGQTGFLVPVANVGALAEAMERLMALPVQERKQMGRMGLRFVTQRFSLSIILDRWESLYQELLHEQARPSRWARPDYKKSASAESAKTVYETASIVLESSPLGRSEAKRSFR